MTLLNSSRLRCSWYSLVLTAVTILLLTSAGLAQTDYTILKNQQLYGNLDQDDTIPPPLGQVMCGPTAAIDSFKYLENAYPAIYGNSLIPIGASGGVDLNLDGNIGDSYDDMIAVAQIVGSAVYMNTKVALGGPGGSGTWDDMFIFGKQKYIEAMLPNQTIYAAQLKSQWAWPGVPPRPADEVPGIARPAWVQDQTQPDAVFLATELADCEDVEILIIDGDWGHFLTVTGIQWVDANNDGLINAGVENAFLHYIDPVTGLPPVAPAPIGGQNVAGDPVRVSYGIFPNAELVMTVSESPIPEPVTLGLLVIGGMVMLRRRHS